MQQRYLLCCTLNLLNQTIRNKYYGKTTRNAIRNLKATEGAEMGEQFPKVASMIDKLAKRNVIHKNKAANLKRKLAKKANAAKATK